MQSTTIIYKTQDSKEFRIPGSVGALVSSSTSSPPGAGASSTTTTTATATTMRPPPPPGPPKTKDNKPERGHEEPSSSIPDLVSKLEYAVLICECLSLDRIHRRFLKYLSHKIDGIYPERRTPQDGLLIEDFLNISHTRLTEYILRRIFRRMDYWKSMAW
ncbi:hypothetical protein AMK59_716 [Oryctes borbonicus]|uniref:Uncharacterized protein n=1 Tax=Oryctes borbonicus TaxID=1629725 RepID=A0A0T6BHH8_9SCAR|nr:hypothetical protein AMK59_716 [Oryctes borbonicus]